MSDLIERLNRQHERVRDPFAIKEESSIFSEAADLIDQLQQERDAGGLEPVDWLNVYRYQDSGKIFVTGSPKPTAKRAQDTRSRTAVSEYLGAAEVYVSKPRQRGLVQ